MSHKTRTDTRNKAAYAIALGRFMCITHCKFGEEVENACVCKVRTNIRKNGERSNSDIGYVMMLYSDRCTYSPGFIKIIASFRCDRES